MAKKQVRIYTVTQVNNLIKAAIEEGVPSRLSMEGEISGWKQHGSGHCYFTLKDDDSQIGCVMWRSSFNKCKFDPENGMSVIARGYVDIYPPQGKLQFYVDSLEPAGLGALQAAFEQMVAKLKQQGLFEDDHKKPLPKFPQKIAILTSESGAAVGDIVDSIVNRWSAVDLLICPVPVQGEGAADEIARTIKTLNEKNDNLGIDLMIVGRGGGSMEDLWAFNEELLARAIFGSKIPIISAVGHEYDVTIADLVADARASTPTKAGVIAVPDSQAVLSELIQIENRTTNLMRNKLELSAVNLKAASGSRVFRNPISLIEIQNQRVDEIASGLASGLRAKIERKLRILNEISEKITKLDPKVRLRDNAIKLNELNGRLQFYMSRTVEAESRNLEQRKGDLAGVMLKKREEVRNMVNSFASRLNAINPKSVLKRGYSITTISDTGKLVRSDEDVKIGEKISTELGEGAVLTSKIEGKSRKK